MKPPQNRLVALFTVLAVSAALLAPVASAQSGPTFLPGQWDGGMWFWHEVRGDGVGVQHVGSGGLDLVGTGHSDGSTVTIGTVTFSVLVRGFGDLGSTARRYDGEWDVRGALSEIAVQGEVEARGTDRLKTDEEGSRTDVPVEFVTEGKGTLVVHSATCASISGTFTASLVANDEGQAVVGVTAPFMAVRGDSEILREHWRVVQEAAEELFFGDDADNPVKPVEDVVAFVELIQQLNQLIADADYCTKEGVPVPGYVHQAIAQMMSNLLVAVISDARSYAAEDLIHLYAMGANLGAFALPGENSIWIQENMPDQLEWHLEVALLNGEMDTVDAIHTAACQWGWAELKRASTVSS